MSIPRWQLPQVNLWYGSPTRLGSAKRASEKVRFVLLAVFFVSLCQGAGTGSALDPGFDAFFNNEFDRAIIYFREQTKVHPDDAGQYNHLAQSILYRELLRNGSLESQLVSGNNSFLRRPKVEIAPADKQEFAESIQKAISLSEDRLKKNRRDTQALYALGVAHGLRSNYGFLVEKTWTEALREAAAARRAHEQVVDIDPKFTDARLILGVYQYIVACLPFYLRAAGFIGGFHGDKEGAFRQLQLVATQGVVNRNDAKVILAALYRREHQVQKALPLLQDLSTCFPRNYLFRLEMVQMYSDAGDKKAALQALEQLEGLRSARAPGYAELQPEKLRFTAGNLYFWYGDLDLALRDLKIASGGTDALDLSTAVMTWLRLGQTQDLLNNHPAAVEAYRQVAKLAPNSEAAAEATKYTASPYQRKPKT
jgi:hypothetical protein